MTDGCISNTNEVVNLINSNSNEFTLHAFGIGGGVSTDLIIWSAKAGNGEHFFVNNEAEGLSECVIQALQAAMEPVYTVEKNLNLNGKVLTELIPLEDTP